MRIAQVLILTLALLPSLAWAQQSIQPDKIQIVRDAWGVPHIFAFSDAETAYGLAWAHSEDNFRDVQLNLITGRGRLGEVLGKEGVLLDFFRYFTGIDTVVAPQYGTQLSAEYRKVVEAYVAGVNAYAAAHPQEVLLKNFFPATPIDLVSSTTLQCALLAGTGLTFKGLVDGILADISRANDRKGELPSGSNGLAMAPSRTDDGKTWLLVNSHQPLEGRFAWYEAHMCSEEGTNFLGALFPGGTNCFVGTNEYLGWAHTTNYHQFGDVYQLKTQGGKNYWHNGAWKPFELRKKKLTINLGGLKLSLTKVFRTSVHGPVFYNKKDKQYYAFRFPSFTDIRAGEQWFRMTKAQNLKEFEQVLRMQAIPLFNTIYGDREGNIMLRSDGKIPLRNPAYNWQLPLDGSKPELIWTSELGYEAKPVVLNPKSGYIYNGNNSPLNATAPADNWKGDFVGLQRFEYNRGDRFAELLHGHKGKFSWADWHRIKYDKAYSQNGSYRKALGNVFRLDPARYPKIADAIRHIQAWDFRSDTGNTHAALALLTHYYLVKHSKRRLALHMILGETVPEDQCAHALSDAKAWLLKYHRRLDVPLGQVQRHVRGPVSLPVGGMTEVPRALHAVPNPKAPGTFKSKEGDSYIMHLKYSKTGVEIQTINAYGASTHPDSPHYTDQMRLFVEEKTKTMTLDKASILRDAKRVYAPR